VDSLAALIQSDPISPRSSIRSLSDIRSAVAAWLCRRTAKKL